jgi:hypothetical protein
MSEAVDKIGVVRDHRWKRASEQIKLLKPRCRKVVSLDGGDAPLISRDDLERLTRPGTVVELVHAFLLADTKRKHTAGGMRADFRAALSRLVVRGVKVVDLDGGVCSQKHYRALIALAESDIARSNRGAKSATNGARSKGRQPAEFTAEQMRDAKAIWRNVNELPTWKDAAKALAKIRDGNGYKFTTARAHLEWGGR